MRKRTREAYSEQRGNVSRGYRGTLGFLVANFAGLKSCVRLKQSAMTKRALDNWGLPEEISEDVIKQRAALTIQSFFRRSIYRIKVESDYYTDFYYPANEIARPAYIRTGATWHPAHEEHGVINFVASTYAHRRLNHRYKPLGIVLKCMMQKLVYHQQWLHKRKERYKKRKNFYFKLTLMKRTKYFGDEALISVTNESHFRPNCQRCKRGTVWGYAEPRRKELCQQCLLRLYGRDH